jgi:hypothetical protein
MSTFNRRDYDPPSGSHWNNDPQVSVYDDTGQTVVAPFWGGGLNSFTFTLPIAVSPCQAKNPPPPGFPACRMWDWDTTSAGGVPGLTAPKTAAYDPSSAFHWFSPDWMAAATSANSGTDPSAVSTYCGYKLTDIRTPPPVSAFIGDIAYEPTTGMVVPSSADKETFDAAFGGSYYSDDPMTSQYRSFPQQIGSEPFLINSGKPF